MNTGIVTNTSRWVRGYARRYNWPQCNYCGRASQSGDCKVAACLACDSRQCLSNGTSCSVCHYGHIPGWGRSVYETECGYKRCGDKPVASAPRVKRVCAEHLSRATVRLAGQTVKLTDYIAARIAERDSGKGTPAMPGWRWAE